MRLRLTALLMLAHACVAAGGMFEEGDWQVAFNEKVAHGQMEVPTPTGRIDILTETHAIEVDHARNYRAGIKQALQYAGATGKKPGLALIMDGRHDTLQAVEAARELCAEAGVDFWLINEHVSVNDLAERKPARVLAPHEEGGGAPQVEHDKPAGSRETGQAYWLNTRTGIRHNRSCRWFGNTAGGQPCGPDEGRPCRECGG